MRGLSRGQFLKRGVVAAGGLALLDPASAFARAAGSPSPIPGGFTADFSATVATGAAFHVLPPAVGAFEVSSITNFKGVIGAAHIQGPAHGSDGTSHDFDADMRFMTGTYVDTDGRLRTGSFGFV
jgi:hypothetical protein